MSAINSFEYSRNDKFAKLAILRQFNRQEKKVDLTKTDFIFEKAFKIQKSAVALTIASVALIIFSKFLIPMFSAFSLIAGAALLSASLISTIREVSHKKENFYEHLFRANKPS